MGDRLGERHTEKWITDCVKWMETVYWGSKSLVVPSVIITVADIMRASLVQSLGLLLPAAN
jgi:hypothetical protein